MNNVVADAPVGDRLADAQLQDLRRPQLQELHHRTIPPPSGEERQVVVRLEYNGDHELPLFHSAGEAPRLKWSVEYDAIDLHADEHVGEEGRLQRKQTGESDDRSQSSLAEKFSVPTHLGLRSIVRVPNYRLYPADLHRRLMGALWGLNVVGSNDVPEILFAEPDDSRILSPFVYLITHRLPLNSISEIQNQTNLF